MKSSTLTALIVDDIPKAVSVMETLIRDYCPGLEVIGTSTEIQDAFIKIKTLKPDLVFLDIELSAGTSFDLLELFPDIDFSIIFVTAHAHYSLQALKLNAIDYLIKPVSIKELITAVEKAQKQIDLKKTVRHLKALQQVFQDGKMPDKIAISTLDGFSFVNLDQIVRLEADGKYTRIQLMGQKPLLASKHLKEFENQLSPHGFFRIHRSHLINLNYIKQYVRGDGGYVVMEDGSTINVAKSKKEAFVSLFDH